MRSLRPERHKPSYTSQPAIRSPTLVKIAVEDFMSTTAGSTSNALAFNTRKSVAQNQAGVVYDLALSSRDTLQARLYGGDRQVTQYLAIPLFVQDAATHSGGVVDLDRLPLSLFHARLPRGGDARAQGEMGSLAGKVSSSE